MIRKKDQTLLFRISWMFLLLIGAAILGFGVLTGVFPMSTDSNELGMIQAIGASTAGMGLFGILITVMSYRKKEKWAWFVLWYYPIFWVFHLLGKLPPGNDHVHQIVFIVMSLLGLILPLRHFFPRETQ
ncbi:hypothetical protein LRR81_12650 [Metabacillus sp. GX 13764]|uniref:hypothetical protein n=1 Tax=Metabacillus kandeliae TaxID=2900151 RepID=UPI001E582FB1|nr:hypothetical protein [Metabacillus kandeliae]MCD7035090.1 hypothetical protein [Metabacillus kandeliae]